MRSNSDQSGEAKNPREEQNCFCCLALICGAYYAGNNAVACMSRFLSYEPSSGSYLEKNGRRYSCP
jgi:hypothetical protein